MGNFMKIILLDGEGGVLVTFSFKSDKALGVQLVFSHTQAIHFVTHENAIKILLTLRGVGGFSRCVVE